MDGWWTDFRHALRGLRREPRVTVFVVMALALGMGSNAAIFGVADKLFLQGPAHVAGPGSLVRIILRVPQRGGGARVSPWLPYQTAMAVKTETGSLSGATLYRFEERVGRVGDELQPYRVGAVDGDFFPLLGTAPMAGRLFDRRSEAPGENPAVISHRLWERALGARSQAVGTSIELAGTTYQVVGVAPPGFSGPHLDAVDVWVPMDHEQAGSRNWYLLGRVGGVEEPDDEARARIAVEADGVHRRTPPGRFFRWAEPATVDVLPLGTDDAGRESPEVAVARLLLAVVALVLLIAGANVVNLLLTRVTHRRDEVVVRVALGAGRGRLLRLLLTESVTLALVGAMASVPVAYAGGTILRRVILPQVAWAGEPVDLRILALTSAVAILLGLLVGALPARAAQQIDIRGGLASERAGRSRTRARTQTALATLQVALSAALLMSAGLFLKSFTTMRLTDLGLDARAVEAVSLRPLEAGALEQGSGEERTAYLAALATARAHPGVERAALSLGVPFMYHFGTSVHVPGRDSVAGVPGNVPSFSAVTGGYFETVGTPILQGAGITEEDVALQRQVAVVSASMAGGLWPRGDALGQCIRFGGTDGPCFTVVGVAADVHRKGYREPPSMQFYVPLVGGESFGGMALLVRPSRGARLSGLADALAAGAASPVHVETTTLATLLDPEIRPWQLGAVVLGLAAFLAVVVSIIGVYGVLSYVVAQRRREIGLRIALGATASSVRAMVLQGGARAAAGGVALGVASVVLARGWVEPLLYETRVWDTSVVAGVALVLGTAAFLACLVPAMHATRVDPVDCLRDGG